MQHKEYRFKIKHAQKGDAVIVFSASRTTLLPKSSWQLNSTEMNIITRFTNINRKTLMKFFDNQISEEDFKDIIITNAKRYQYNKS